MADCSLQTMPQLAVPHFKAQMLKIIWRLHSSLDVYRYIHLNDDVTDLPRYGTVHMHDSHVIDIDCTSASLLPMHQSNDACLHTICPCSQKLNASGHAMVLRVQACMLSHKAAHQMWSPTNRLCLEDQGSQQCVLRSSFLLYSTNSAL